MPSRPSRASAKPKARRPSLPTRRSVRTPDNPKGGQRRTGTRPTRPGHFPGEQIGELERIADRRLKALNLRRRGASYREIARLLSQELGVAVDVKTAYEDVQAELCAVRKLTEEQAEEVRQLELERLDGLLVNLASKLAKGDAYAVDVARKVSESRRKLLGLDAPTKIAPTTPAGDALPTALDLAKLPPGVVDAVIAALEAAEPK